MTRHVKPNAGAADEAHAPEGAENSRQQSAAAAETDTLRTELAEAKDRALRATAELENFRLRSRREADESLKYANMSLLRDLLPVVDNLARAMAAAEQSSDGSGLLAGVQMVASQLEEVLARHSCKRIEALGEPFDPNYHEAIAQQPSADYPAGTVMLEAATGFRLHDRVVRPTQVIVSTGPAS